MTIPHRLTRTLALALALGASVPRADDAAPAPVEAAPAEAAPAQPTSAAVLPSPQPPQPPQAAGPLIGGPATPQARDAEIRALERALMQRGGLLLPEWRVELAPELAFSGADSDSAVVTSEGAFRANARTQLLVGSATLRLGLPWDLQLEAAVPFGEARRTVSGGGQSWSRDRWGIGDVRLALSYQLWRGAGRAPDVLVAATWKGATAASPYASPLPQWVSLGSGLVDVGGTVTVVKPADPLVLLGSLGLARSLPRATPLGRVDAGLEAAISLAAILAVSPDTSISLGLDQKYAPAIRIDGRSQAGTDRMGVSFEVGVATLVSGRSFVQLTTALGLTRDVPAFQVGLSVPMRLR